MILKPDYQGFVQDFDDGFCGKGIERNGTQMEAKISF
jgi:hypothetical protein